MTLSFRIYFLSLVALASLAQPLFSQNLVHSTFEVGLNVIGRPNSQHNEREPGLAISFAIDAPPDNAGDYIVAVYPQISAGDTWEFVPASRQTRYALYSSSVYKSKVRVIPIRGQERVETRNAVHDAYRNLSGFNTLTFFIPNGAMELSEFDVNDGRHLRVLVNVRVQGKGHFPNHDVTSHAMPIGVSRRGSTWTTINIVAGRTSPFTSLDPDVPEQEVQP